MYRFILQLLRQRQDLILVALVMLTIVLMILPMPVGLMDALIALNISLTILVLTVVIYLKRPDQFSTFPALILIGTAFRLAISISTTRLILSQADAGEVILTFGTVVTAGNVIVGLVIFLIITTVQFLVITKGSERVAEVAARFVLDALPGRQMSIDAELRAGDLTAEDAKQRRRQLDRENQFYGAMDGAMKFVKGDAIAGLIIIAVNLIGGIAVGMVVHNLSIGDAIEVYSRLTIGDGLVAQIPALFMSLSAGTVVTRVTSDDQSDLSTDMVRQLIGQPRALWISAVVVGAIGFFPGFPTPVFGGLGAALAILAFTLTRRSLLAARAVLAQAEGPVAPAETAEAAQIAAPLAGPDDLATIRVGTSLLADIPAESFGVDRAAASTGFAGQVGIPAPQFGLREDAALDGRSYEIDVDNVPVFSGQIPPQSILLETDREVADLAGITVTPAGQEWPIGVGHWAAQQNLAKAQAASIAVRTPGQVLIALTLHYLRQNIGHIVGFRDMQRLVGELQTTAPEIAQHISQNVTPARTLDILRRLLDEGVSLSARRILFEAIAELGPQEADPALLVEQIRRAMRRQICNGVADRNRVISAYVVEPDLEQLLRASLRQTETGSYLILSSGISARLLEQLGRIRAPLEAAAQAPVVATSSDLRRHLRSYLVEHGLNLPVISFQEVAPEFYLQPIGTLSGSDAPFDPEMDLAN